MNILATSNTKYMYMCPTVILIIRDFSYYKKCLTKSDYMLTNAIRSTGPSFS